MGEERVESLQLLFGINYCTFSAKVMQFLEIFKHMMILVGMNS